MQRLLDDFAELFDLDRRVRGERLGDLIRRMVEDLDARVSPDWGSPGPADRWVSEHGRALDFYYAPHLFPEMDPKLRLGHQLQFSMLPREVPDGAPLTIAAVLESYCHLSGDLFGWEMLADGRFLLWIVDMSGHGVRSGLASAMLKVLIDNLRQRGEVEGLAAELNDAFAGCLRDDKSNLFATGFFLALGAEGSARYASAGHPPMLLRKSDGRVRELGANGIPLGMFAGSRFDAAEVRLDPGDTLLLYTDGVVETVNGEGEEFGLDRLRSALEAEAESPQARARSLYRTVAAHQDMQRLNDDVTFVVGAIQGTFS